MIQLHPDYLLFQTSNGETIPLPVERVIVEIVGDDDLKANKELIQNAAVAVLHYYKYDLGRVVVSVAEFTQTLEHVLASLGATVVRRPSSAAPAPDCDLSKIAAGVGETMELFFFPQLRSALRASLVSAPKLLRFHGLRHCVKALLKAKRWSPRCQILSDQIVDYLRDCLSLDDASGTCGLLVR
jgi:hypothetical protein